MNGQEFESEGDPRLSAAPAAREIDFIRRHTRVQSVPAVPEVRLHVAIDLVEFWKIVGDQFGTNTVPFWAFPWPGGQALARYLLDHPEVVRGHAVLDFAAGSGLVGIAAARAGAASVIPTEIDRLAQVAVGLNAGENGVILADLRGDVLDQTIEVDVVLAGDVFYERKMSERVLAFLEREARRGARVLVGDPGRPFVRTERWPQLAAYDIVVPPGLEDREVKRTAVLQLARE